MIIPIKKNTEKFSKSVDIKNKMYTKSCNKELNVSANAP